MENLDIYLHMIAMVLILVFTICYTFYIITLSNSNTFFKLICVSVFIAAIYIAVNRNTYLPFLGQTVIPPAIFSQELVPSGANVSYVLNVPNVENGTYILYWGAQSSANKDIIQPNPKEAYGDYSNTGLIKVKDNKAILYFNCPDKYNVFNNHTIQRHIHYRIITPENCMISQVHTAYVNC